MNGLDKISTYYLCLELLNGGEAGLLPEVESLLEEDILGEMKHRTGKDFGNDKERWARFVIGSPEYGSELERSNLMIFMDTPCGNEADMGTGG